MPYYAQINNGAVVAVTETSSQLEKLSDLVEIDSLNNELLGKTYDRASGLFVATEPAPEPRHITVGALYDRFGSAKWGILADQSSMVQAVIKNASVRKYIDLDNPDLPQGLAIVQGAGHQIDPASIISAPVQANEKP